MTDDPAQLLTDLIRLRRPIRTVSPLVDALPILEEDLVDLTTHDAVNVLQKFLAGEISGEEVGMWADALDLHLFDGVRVTDDRVRDVVSQLAMEYAVEGRVSEHHADDHLRELRAARA